MNKFTLKVDPVKVDREFKMIERSRDRLTNFNPMVTKLEDLGISEIHSNSHSPLVHIKDSKMIIFNHLHSYMEHGTLPEQTSVCCFHCTESFTGKPLGIPVEYIVSQYMTTYKIDKEDIGTTNRYPIYTKKEKEKIKKMIEKNNELEHITLDEREYFEVDGNFCSFPCMIAYYKANQNKIEYKNSQNLINRLHKVLYNEPLVWKCAPDIRLLKKFGGHLSIEEFRSAEGSHYTESNGFYRVKPESQPTGYPLVPISKMFNYTGNKY
jgi:hypothetical protein